jgi:hypothetical protein
MTTRCIAMSLAIAVVVTATSPVRADDVHGAAKAFSQAQQAMLAGDATRAADLYELADELAASAVALRSAARARLAAGHLALAAINATALLRRYPNDRESREVAETILSRIAPQLAQLEVTCTTACAVLIDGKVIASLARPQHSLFILPGARTVTASFDDVRKSNTQITAVAGRTARVRLEAPANPVAPRIVAARAPSGDRRIAGPSTGSSGLSRWWVAAGTIVTLGLGAATVVSGMATLETRDKIRDAVAAGQDAAARMSYSTGRDQQIRTNLLLGVTGAAAAGTIVFAIFTNWSGDTRERTVAVVPASESLSFVYRARF